MKKGVLGGVGVGGGGGNRTPGDGPFLVIADGKPTQARKDAKSKLVACSEGDSSIPNSYGQRIGEDHPRAVLTNAQADQIRDRHEAMQVAYSYGGPRVSLKPLAKEFGVSIHTIKDIVYYRRRNVWPARWKRITTD